MGLLFIYAISELTIARASSTVHLFRFSLHRRPCGGVSFAFASEPEPNSDHLQMSWRSVDCFDSFSLSGLKLGFCGDIDCLLSVDGV
ncbi:hypothetical protein TIFTF001_043147 [Ficus carica]|uniref:Uncharacterized protein n=1 Tax=Ficus carica TaxID=3494 RepID=A0AA87Z2G6_FICCA|nr:hypothetical protein TIFTF001_043147 [Ficus carica]